MSYDIIATLGPASVEPELWQQMLAAGASGFRLNTSHLNLADLNGWLERLASFRDECGVSFGVTLDLQGSKWRVGQFPAFELAVGQPILLILASEADRPGCLPVPHVDFFQAAQTSGGEIVLNDAKSRMVIEEIGAERLRARVTLGGPISPHKGITFNLSDFRKESLNQKDSEIVRRARELDWVDYAVSYVRDGQELRAYRETLGAGLRLIAKLERGSAMEDAAGIAAQVEGLWLCRGDLGAELGLAGMAAAAHRFAGQVPGLPCPAFLAGQVLEHMTTHSTPTRAEICGIYDALQAGYCGVVLSDETAIGANPVLAVRAAAGF